MFLLAIDTSGKNGSVALARVTAGRAEVETLEVVPLGGGTFSAQLVPQISALLAKHGYNKSCLDAFAVVSGPGSFTGLRVGLAAIKALAEVLQKPVSTVSLLEAIACSGPAHSRVLAALDAGRGELYLGDYETNEQPTMRGERLLSRDEFLDASKGRLVLTPDPTIAAMARAAGIEVEQIAYPRTDAIARLGWAHLLRGETVPPEALDANYIRRSDAEIFSPAKPVKSPSAIRPATLCDIPAIRALEQQALSAAHWPAEEYEKLIATGIVLVAEQAGELCGSVCAKAVGGEWELENVVVASNLLRRGVADSLMGALLDRAERAAASKIFLEVRESNQPARRLYEKHEFRETGRRRNYYQHPPEDAILYVRFLKSTRRL